MPTGTLILETSMTDVKTGDKVLFEGCNMFGDHVNGWVRTDEKSLELTICEVNGVLYGTCPLNNKYNLHELANDFDVYGFNLLPQETGE